MGLTSEQRRQWIKLHIAALDTEQCVISLMAQSRRQHLMDGFGESDHETDATCDCEIESPCWVQGHLNRRLDVMEKDWRGITAARKERDAAERELIVFLNALEDEVPA